MRNYLLAFNCGSSSLKFNLFMVEHGTKLEPYMQGIVEEIGNPDRSRLRYELDGKKQAVVLPIQTHEDGLTHLFRIFADLSINTADICAVGHRVVHGGDKYLSSVLIDETVKNTIRDLIPIAPLHNPPNLTGIEVAQKLLPGVPQVAVFDTAFHGSAPAYAYKYAIPEVWYAEYGVRRYGFHGTSHLYVSRRAACLLNIPYERFNGITVHLGNGCSITKIEGGRSVDTSMGFTPLEGLVMGTRSGDIDPAMISHVTRCLVDGEGLDETAAYRRVMQALNKESGLKALTGSSIMQDLRQRAIEGDEEAGSAILIYAYRVAKYIGAYWATLPETHAIVFTAGVGENEGYIRKKILGFLKSLQFQVNEDSNGKRKLEIEIAVSTIQPGCPLSVLVIPTDEEIVIGYDTLYLGYLKQPLPQRYPFEQ